MQSHLYDAERLGPLELREDGLEEEVEVLAEAVARPLDERRHQATHERRRELAPHGVQQLTRNLSRKIYASLIYLELRKGSYILSLCMADIGSKIDIPMMPPP